MLFYAGCDKCHYSMDLPINDSITIEEFLALVEKEHREESPSCPTEPMQLRISASDPNIQSLVSEKIKARRSSIVHVERHGALQGPTGQ